MALNFVLLTVALALCDYPSQPRSSVDPEYVHALRDSMKAHGQKVPIIGYWFGKRFVVTDGGCRLEAARMAGIPELMALDLGEEPTAARCGMAQASIDQHKKTLPPVDKARLYRQMLDDDGLTAKALAHALGVSEAYVCRKFKLLKLCPEVQAMVNGGAVEESKGCSIADATEDPKRQVELALSGLKRDQIPRRGAPEPDAPVVKVSRVKVALKTGVTVQVAGGGICLADIVKTFSDLHASAKSAAAAGYDAKTWQAMMADLQKPAAGHQPPG